jgi:hypothetical protein
MSIWARLTNAIRQRWALHVRPRLPPAIMVAAGRLLALGGLDARLLHWLIPDCRPAGFFTLTPDTPPALYASLRRLVQTGVSGDYYEFGLYRGFTLWFAQQAAARWGLNEMRFIGFDSFRGLPEPRGQADGQEFATGDYACDRATVIGHLSRFGVDWARTSLVEGYFDSSLALGTVTGDDKRRVAIALIDCDLYTSTVPVLEFLEGRLQDGSLLLFDDWNCFGKSDDHGERRAFREFLRRYPRWVAEPLFAFGWHGQAFAIQSSVSPPGPSVIPRLAYGETR